MRAAFLVGVPVAGLGRLPVNAMAVFAVAALGFAEPSLWLAGLGLEVAVVGALSFNPRFQRVIDARDVPLAIKAEADQRSELVARLPGDLQDRLAGLNKNASRVIAICKRLAAEPELLAGTEASLDKLQWIYLKLLVARDHLVNDLGAESGASLLGRMETLRGEMRASAGGGGQQAGLRRSQEATLSLLERRLANLNNREHLLMENESDLRRIETQVSLMRENAAIDGKPAAVDLEIEFATDLGATDLGGSDLGGTGLGGTGLGGDDPSLAGAGAAGLYGKHGELVRALDRARSG